MRSYKDRAEEAAQALGCEVIIKTNYRGAVCEITVQGGYLEWLGYAIVAVLGHTGTTEPSLWKAILKELSKDDIQGYKEGRY